MTALERLASHGFTNAAVVGTQKGRTIVRVRTANGWMYEKFETASLADAIDAWAAKNMPG